MQPMVNIALRAARSAGEMIVKSADNLDLVKVDEKGRHDFVTEVDRRSEETIIYHISKAYPDHRFICEESGVSGNLMPSLIIPRNAIAHLIGMGLDSANNK